MVKVRAYGLQSREGSPLAKKTDNRTGSLGFEAKLWEAAEGYVSGSALPRVILKDLKRLPLVNPDDEALSGFLRRPEAGRRRRAFRGRAGFLRRSSRSRERPGTYTVLGDTDGIHG